MVRLYKRAKELQQQKVARQPTTTIPLHHRQPRHRSYGYAFLLIPTCLLHYTFDRLECLAQSVLLQGEALAESCSSGETAPFKNQITYSLDVDRSRWPCIITGQSNMNMEKYLAFSRNTRLCWSPNVV